MKQVSVLSILIAVLLLITASTAGAVSNAAVLYLRVAAGARPAGMGEAFVAIADDATATYWNPAGLGNAPVAGQLETKTIPQDFDDITDVITMKSYQGKTETWMISGDRLIMYDGKSWNTGRSYMTSSDQTLHDFLRTIMSIVDEDELEFMSEQVVSANCDVTPGEVETFAETIRANTPEDYHERDELERGLDTLAAGYKYCLLNTERFKNLQDKLKKGLEDSLFTDEELDKITYSLEQAVLRFLPSQLMVPYASAIFGKMICLATTGNYLWVGTDNGLYRHSVVSWARYSTEHGLPSDTILTMDDKEEHLLIGTAGGMGEYYHGAFNIFTDLPFEPVKAVSFGSPVLGYAVVGDLLYRYDGQKWHDSFSYTVRIDDTIEKIVERIGLYYTPSEYDYLAQKIRELNATNVPSIPEQPAIVEDSAADSTAEIAEEIVMDEAPAPAESWLVDSNVIQLPNSPRFRYNVTALLTDDINGIVWIGTSSGLLSFNGQTWNRYGYKAYTIPGPDSTGEMIMMTAEEIARYHLPLGDSARITALTENIDDYNELNGQPLSSGNTVYVYSHNTGATIHSIGKVFGDLYIGTEYSLENLTSEGWKAMDFSRYDPQPDGKFSREYENWAWAGWEAIKIGHLERQRFKGVYDFDNQAYYVGERGIGVETKGRREFVVMFVKWLPTLDLDMYYGFVSYVHHARGLGTFGISAVYLSYGSLEFRDEAGNYIGEGNPFEFSLGLSYGTSLNSKTKLGGTVKIIHSHLASIGAGKEQGSGIAWAFAVDAGLLFKFTDRIQLGSAFTNLGPDISYIDAAQADPLPRNFAIGLSYRIWDTPYNSLVLQGELNKILTNLNKGFSRELENAIRHFGAEYWYSDFIAVRAGYKFDKEGQVKHLTFGAGLQYDAARFDLAYVPSSVDSPLANTLRISFSLMF